MKNNRLGVFMPSILELTSDGENIRVLPESILLIRYGVNAYTKNNENGEFEFTQEDADCVIADFEAKGHDLVIDYEHQSLSGEKAPAAGWIHRLEKCPDGILAYIRYWTEEAKEYLLAGQYRYFSPTLYFSRSGKHVTAIHSAALTNHPAMHGIPALVADDLTVSAEEGFASQTETLSPMTNEPTLSGKDNIMNELLLKLLPESFSSAGEEQRNLALKERVETLLLQEEQLQAFFSRSGFADLAQAEESLQKAAALEHRERIRHAFDEGKLCESMRSWAERFASGDPAGFDLWVQEAPRIVPDNSSVDQICTAAQEYTDSVSDPEQKKIFRLLGLTPEEGKISSTDEKMKGNN